MSQDRILEQAWRAYVAEPSAEAALSYCVKLQRPRGPTERAKLTYPEAVKLLDASKTMKRKVRLSFAVATRKLRRQDGCPADLLSMKDLADALTLGDFQVQVGCGDKTPERVEQVFDLCALSLHHPCEEEIEARASLEPDLESAYYEMRGSWAEAIRELNSARKENRSLKLDIARLVQRLPGRAPIRKKAPSASNRNER